MATNNQYQKITPFILFVLVLILFFKLIQPVITILLSSALLAYVTFPLHKRIGKKIHNKYISIGLSIFIVILIILIPFTFLAIEISQQGYSFYSSLSNENAKGAVFGFGCTSSESKVCSILNQGEKFSLEQLSKVGFDKQLQKFVPFLEEKITNFILSLPLIIASVFFMIVITYFILCDWEKMLEKIVELLPMRKKTVNRLVKEFGGVTYTVVYAQLFVALIQGVVATIGFFIFGVPFPIVLGLVVAFFSLIPTIGTALVWFPISLFMIASGYLSNDSWMFGKGIGLFLYGLLIISTIDNVLLAKIVHERAKVNPIVVIIGVIGGAAMFGFAGIFIGPILLPLLVTYFQTFKERFD